MKKVISFLLLSIFTAHSFGLAETTEVLPQTNTAVVVRNHPKTGKAYATIVAKGNETHDNFSYLYSGKVKNYTARPDYRLLDPKVKSGQIPYEGPVSDNKKIYIFAASLATLGVTGGALALAFPAASTAAAGGGALYTAGGAAVAAGTAATAYEVTKTDPKKDNFTQHSESQTKELSTK